MERTSSTNCRMFRWDRVLPGGISVAMIGQQTRRLPAGSYRIRHPFWVLDYAFSTRTQYRVGSVRRRWRDRFSNTAHLYPPDTPYWERRPGNKYVSHSAHICFWRGEDAGLNTLINSPARFAGFEDSDGILGGLLHQGSILVAENEETSFWDVQAVLCKAIGLLLSARHLSKENFRISRRNVGTVHQNRLVVTVREYLREHLNEKVTLSRIAEDLKVSRSRLTHVYGTETGEGPLTTHMTLRIESVKQRLLMGESLKTVAPRYAFCDVYHLSKAFKKNTGLSPREFMSFQRGSAKAPVPRS